MLIQHGVTEEVAEIANLGTRRPPVRTRRAARRRWRHACARPASATAPDGRRIAPRSRHGRPRASRRWPRSGCDAAGRRTTLRRSNERAAARCPHRAEIARSAHRKPVTATAAWAGKSPRAKWRQGREDVLARRDTSGGRPGRYGRDLRRPRGSIGEAAGRSPKSAAIPGVIAPPPSGPGFARCRMLFPDMVAPEIAYGSGNAKVLPAGRPSKGGDGPRRSGSVPMQGVVQPLQIEQYRPDIRGVDGRDPGLLVRDTERNDQQCAVRMSRHARREFDPGLLKVKPLAELCQDIRRVEPDEAVSVARSPSPLPATSCTSASQPPSNGIAWDPPRRPSAAIGGSVSLTDRRDDRRLQLDRNHR